MGIYQTLRSRNKHFIQNRTIEIWLGFALFVIGSFLLYDAFDSRGKKMPWPAGAIAPW